MNLAGAFSGTNGVFCSTYLRLMRCFFHYSTTHCIIQSNHQIPSPTLSRIFPAPPPRDPPYPRLHPIYHIPPTRPSSPPAQPQPSAPSPHSPTHPQKPKNQRLLPTQRLLILHNHVADHTRFKHRTRHHPHNYALHLVLSKSLCACSASAPPPPPPRRPPRSSPPSCRVCASARLARRGCAPRVRVRRPRRRRRRGRG